MSNKTLTIGALNRYIKYVLNNDGHLNSLEVLGEISNYTPRIDKHMYFTLKDDESRIKCVMFSSSAKSLEFTPKNGDKVVIKGKVDVYAPSGEYQIIVTSISLDGQGDLLFKYQQLKEKLEKEGLFASDLKKSIPKYPKRIGVITSSSGAAIRDIVSTINRRYKNVDIFVFNTIVQGENSAPSIINSLNLSLKYNLDTVIIGRGGGSIEDLWSFNDETVIRAIYNYPVPIISAVGHETDTTLCDFVCDLRAETPTAAAVMATPNYQEEITKFLNLERHLKNLLQNIVNNKKSFLDQHSTIYFNNYLKRLLLQNQNEYLMLVKDIDDVFNNLVRNKQDLVFNLSNKLDLNINKVFEVKSREYFQNSLILEQLSPLKILSRGYSISYSNNRIVKSVDDISDNIKIMLSDGEVSAKISEKEVKKYGAN